MSERGSMLQQMKAFLGISEQKDTDTADEQEQLVHQLQSEISRLRQQQEQMAQELSEAQIRNDFKRIELDHKLQALREKSKEIDRAERQLQDIAIEEKLDMSRLSSGMKEIREDAADADEMQERIQRLQDYIKHRENAVKEDITVIEAAIQDTVAEMRQDLVDSFQKEFLALETVMTYEMDAMEAQDRWAHEDLSDRIDAVQRKVDTDIAEMEAETVALLKTNTDALENRLETQKEQLVTAQEALEQQVNTRLEELSEHVQDQISALPDAADLAAAEDNIVDLQEELDAVREQLQRQQGQIDTARTELRERLNESINEIQEENIQPLRDAVTTLQEDINKQVPERINTIQQAVDRRERQETADRIGLEARIDEVEQQVEQELAVSETAQAARRQDIQEDIGDTLAEHDRELAEHADRLSEQAGAIESLRNGIKKAINMIEEVDVDMNTVQSRMEQLAAAEDVETVRDTVNQLQEEVAEKAPLETIEQLQEHIDTLRNRINAVDEQKADTEHVAQRIDAVVKDVGSVQDKLGAVQEQKADQESVMERMETLSQTLDSVKEEMEKAQDTLEERITDLVDTAAEADTVTALENQLNALQDAAARQEIVQEELSEVREDLTALRKQTPSEEDVVFLNRRVQKIREQLDNTDERSKPSTKRHRGKYVRRNEFERLEDKVDELSDYVLQLLNQEK